MTEELEYPPLSWIQPQGGIRLDADEAHVWRADLNFESAHMRALERTLSEDERARAKRFYFQQDRDRFVAARGLLRNILSLYIHRRPHQLRFSYGPYGKPALSRRHGQREIRFNVSHSHGLALYAVTRNREVGVDIERIQPHLTQQQIAERFFAPEECQRLRTLPREKQVEAFYECWTRKEAYLKVQGKSLNQPPDHLPMTLVSAPSASGPTIIDSSDEIRKWALWQLAPGAGYAGALVVEGGGKKLRRFEWPEEEYGPVPGIFSSEDLLRPRGAAH
jgi:4'-phosphopantetheinyl transferase